MDVLVIIEDQNTWFVSTRSHVSRSRHSNAPVCERGDGYLRTLFSGILTTQRRIGDRFSSRRRIAGRKYPKPTSILSAISTLLRRTRLHHSQKQPTQELRLPRSTSAASVCLDPKVFQQLSGIGCEGVSWKAFGPREGLQQKCSFWRLLVCQQLSTSITSSLLLCYYTWAAALAPSPAP